MDIAIAAHTQRIDIAQLGVSLEDRAIHALNALVSFRRVLLGALQFAKRFNIRKGSGGCSKGADFMNGALVMRAARQQRHGEGACDQHAENGKGGDERFAFRVRGGHERSR